MATKYPPALSLIEAVRVIKEMYEQHRSREVSVDLMPDILGVKQGSSYFPAKVSALQKFGFVEKLPNDLLFLTDFAMQIVSPIANEDKVATIEAFKKIDVLYDLLQKHSTANRLPSPDQLKMTLHKSYGIPKERLKDWFEFVTDSYRALPQSGGEEKEGPKSVAPGGDLIYSLFGGKQPTQDYQFTVPIGGNEAIKVSIPQSATKADLLRVKAMIDAIANTEE